MRFQSTASMLFAAALSLSTLNAARADGSSLNAVKLSGTWTTDCVQTQDNGKSGFVHDSVTFDQAKVDFQRQWYVDAQCTQTKDVAEITHGTYTLGNDTTAAFNTQATEVDWTIDSKVEKGLISVNDAKKELRLSRGFGDSSQRNTMLSLFVYRKQ